MILIRTSLACSLILASAIGFAADGTQPPAADDQAARTTEIRHKLNRIVIPKLDFHEATVREAVDFLKKKSAELDVDSPGGNRGVNIVLKLAGPNEAAPGAASSAPVEKAADARITVSLTNVPLLEALKYVTGLADLRFQVEPYAVSIVPLNPPAGTLITQEWKIPPDLIPRTPVAHSAGAADSPKAGTEITDRLTAKKWLIANGVTFDGAATAIYIIRSSRLIVRNTQDQLDLVDTIIHEGQGGGPVSVEIECQLIEISGDDLKELTFDALLRQFNSPATKNVFISGGDVGHPVKPASPAGLVIRGSNASNFEITPGSIEVLTFPKPDVTSHVFTDPQFQTVLRGLKQKKGVEFLSIPKMTVKSGQPLAVDVIRAFHHPLEDTPPQIPAAPSSLAPAEFPAASPLRPGQENREFDVALEVEPVAGPDGYTIDLNLSHQVMEFEGDVGRGTPSASLVANPATGVPAQNILTPRLHPPPIFSTRKETQSVSIYEGSTVVLAGFSSEDVPTKVENKDLLLGRVPFLGPSSPSSRAPHTKRKLFIFVTSRLVNAGSVPVGADEEKEEVIEVTEPPELLPPTLPLMPK
ncbi:MAG: hypothetical protein ABJF10_28655 [Chthoniobacter sp.]|uniref:hypothetical protein n=1 Tax=Chthoniobacter sp. TaxID=2510640 RepID=UPI0032A85797